MRLLPRPIRRVSDRPRPVADFSRLRGSVEVGQDGAERRAELGGSTPVVKRAGAIAEKPLGAGHGAGRHRSLRLFEQRRQRQQARKLVPDLAAIDSVGTAARAPALGDQTTTEGGQLGAVASRGQLGRALSQERGWLTRLSAP